MTVNGSTSTPDGLHHDGYTLWNEPLGTLRPVRMIVIGAGASGLCAAYKFKKHLKQCEFVLYEINEDIGGTWLENRYPGCACDVPSHSYQFSFEPWSQWSQYYSSSVQIHQYLKMFADKHNLNDNVKLKHRVTGCSWDVQEKKWKVKIENLETSEIISDECDFLLNASGILNNWKWPDIRNLHSFKGDLVHSARWPQDLDLTDKDVGIIGVGSTSIQIIPTIQPQVKSLTPFIRSPTWITPGFAVKYAGPDGKNFTYTEEQKAIFEKDPEAYLAYRKGVEQEINVRFRFAIKDSPSQAEARKAATEDMSRRLKGNKVLIEKLIPSFAVGCRRPTPGQGFLEALVEKNVHPCISPILEVTPNGILTEDGKEHKFDVLITATGFDTSFKPRFPLIGENGIDIRELWDDGKAESYMSVMANGFPNYFIFLGPSAPVGHGSLIPIIELICDYACKTIYKWQNEPNLASIQPTADAQREFNIHRNTQLQLTCWSSHCTSWFKAGKKDGPVLAMHPGSRVHFFTMLKNPRWQDFKLEYEDGNRYKYLGNGFTTMEVNGEDLTWYLDERDNLRLEI